MGKLINTLTNFFSNPVNIYGLMTLLVVVISTLIFDVITFGAYIIVLICIGLLNIIAYTLGCKNSAMYYIENLDILGKLMDKANEEIHGKKSNKNEELTKELWTRIKKRHQKEWEDDDIK
jgi:hypothetical protein